MKILTVLIVALLIILSSCTNTVYWRETRRGGIERYQWNRPGWPREHGCSTYYTRQPVKQSTMRKLYFYRTPKK